MMSFSISDMLKKAEEDGGLSGESADWPDSNYKLEILKQNFKPKTGGTASAGLFIKSLEGPTAGQTKWFNMNIDPEHEVSSRVFIQTLLALGISTDLLKEDPEPQQVLEMLPGTVFTADVSYRPSKTTSSKFLELKHIKQVTEDVDAPAAVESSGGTFGAFDK